MEPPYPVTVLSSAARTTAQTSQDFQNNGGRGLAVVVDITTVVDSPSLTVTIQGKDEASGKYYTLLASAALTGTGTTRYRIYPGLTADANVVASDVLPRTWRVTVAVADADSATYSIGAVILA